MSKYNNIKSISIDSLTKEELKDAIKEWSENDEAMEKLLWALYNNGIKTNGCHAGMNPYIGIDYNKKNNDINVKLMNSMLNIKGSQLLIIPEGKNPLSGPDWYKPSITLGSDASYKDVADEQFESIIRTINNENKVQTLIDTSPILDLLDFFIEKYTTIIFRIKHNNDDSFIFSIEGIVKEESELYKYFNTCLKKLNFTLIIPKIGHRKYWEYITKDSKEMNKILKDASTLLINNYSLKIPTSVDETDLFSVKAHIMRKKLSEEEFQKWVEIEKNNK